MNLLGRSEEIKSLEWDLSKDEPQFIAVYGRRRVGKTYLIREMFRDQFAFLHTGLRAASRHDQLAAFRASLIRSGHLKCPVLKSWLEAFDELYTLIELLPAGRKIIFIDELPWMDTLKSGLITGLESFWNGRATARREKDVFLIVCGSASSWIVKKMLQNCGGLYGRLTDRLHLKPFTLGECEIYAERLGLHMTRSELCDAYMVLGGIPYYWSLLRPDLTLAQNIDALFFAANGKLRDEYDYLYASIFKNPDPYIKVIEALAQKKIGLTREDILTATGLKNGGNFKTLLEELEQCDFIRMYTPCGRENRGALFQLIDNFTLFYHAFLADKKKKGEHFWSDGWANPRIQSWKGHAFERVCLQHVPQIKQALGISGIQTFESAWRSHSTQGDVRGAQIDLVLERGDRTYDLCEMKYTDGAYEIDKDEDTRLRNRRTVFQREVAGRKNCRIVLVSPDGLARNKYSGTVQACITLDDLFRTV